jgi:hypothetical protein
MMLEFDSMLSSGFFIDMLDMESSFEKLSLLDMNYWIGVAGVLKLK